MVFDDVDGLECGDDDDSGLKKTKTIGSNFEFEARMKGAFSSFLLL